ncbi:MAG: hypothetical protein U5Q44_06865 [Dehalococcoidia bacterium]|nr:hypothetical protein [Dehalococcoidia bacterium]
MIRTITVRAEAPLTVHGLVFLDSPSGQYVASVENDVTTQGDDTDHAFEMLWRKRWNSSWRMPLS